MKLKHIISTQQFERQWLESDFFPLVEEMEVIAKKGGNNILSGKRMALLFYEPSTRTRASFQFAMNLLGGTVAFATENAREFSSAAKGESLEDTIRVVGSYFPDVIVLRYDEEGGAQKAAKISSVPIINAGDGTGEHPTQALLDLYTIKKEFGYIDGIVIAMVGDLAKGRTARSLARLLSKFGVIKMYFVSPQSSKMRDDVKRDLERVGISFFEETDLREVTQQVDVIYQTRVQTERGSLNFGDEDGFFTVNQEVLNLMPSHAIVMHPLPHCEEIAPEVDSDHRAAYFRQAQNGLYVRMALLKKILSS